MNKKISIITISIGIITIIVSLFFLLKNRKFFFEIKLTNELKTEISERIDIMTSDYHCNQLTNDKEKSNCIYFNNTINGSDYSEKDEVYYLILSNMDNAKELKNNDNIVIKESDEKMIQGKYLATHSISQNLIKDKYSKFYGSSSNKNLSLANELDRGPRVKYSSKDNVFYVSYLFGGEKINSTISKDFDYKVDGNKITVHRAVVYLSDLSSEGFYSVYKDSNLSGDVLSEIKEEDISIYDIEIGNSTVYKFEFEVTLSGRYKFISLDKVDNYS